MGSNLAQFAVLKLLISVSPPLRNGPLRTLALIHLPRRVVSLSPNPAVDMNFGKVQPLLINCFFFLTFDMHEVDFAVFLPPAGNCTRSPADLGQNLFS